MESNSNNSNNSGINGIPNAKPEANVITLNGGKTKAEVKRAEAAVFLLCSLLMAVLYTVCFTGVNIYPQLSFFVFSCLALIILCSALNKTGNLKSKKAFVWALPIVVISAFNAFFNLNPFSYSNVIAVHLMFAALVFSAVTGEKNEFSKLSCWFNYIKLMFSNFIVPFGIFKVLKGGSSAKEGGRGIIKRVLIGAAIALPFLFLLTVLLANADAVFGVYVERVFNFFSLINADFIWHIVVVFIAVLYFLGYIYNALYIIPSKEDIKPHKIDTVIGSTFLGLINLLFLFFCVVQTAFLFTGGYMQLPEGIVYSAYAREGFFQLLFVTVINFGVILIFLKVFPDCVNSKPLKFLITMLCVFTGVLIASSFYRMALYTEAYGYTDIRMCVIIFLSMETVLVFVTLWYLFKRNFDFIRSYVLIAVVFYVVVNIASSAYVVGRLNVNRFYNGYDLDVMPLCQNEDTARLLAEVYNTPEFEERMNAEQKDYAKITLERFKERDEAWQNFSVLKNLR
ncbi:MAG: DUF4173 domain-containing protein [Clostridiales bacterium]|nr:DUF4173 domain-containing protein [Clostridiales bacterium]